MSSWLWLSGLMALAMGAAIWLPNEWAAKVRKEHLRLLATETDFERL